MGALRMVLAAARRRLGRAVHRVGGATQADVRELRAEIQQLVTDRLDAHGARLAELTAVTQSLVRAGDELDARLLALENIVSIEAVGRFLRHARLGSEPLVSVVLPTYDRPAHLRRAIDSVVEQSYARWELLVVDDGSHADSKAVVEETRDERIRWVRIENQGVCAARNTALQNASGELIAYLDDDNVMDPDWLYSVAWAFDQHPEVEVLYGAFVVDDVLRLGGKDSGELPRTFLHPWNREQLRRGNLADIGAIAHRNGLEQARFDESLREMGDWDLLLRLTAERDPLVLPAIACYYTTDAPNRLSGGPTYQADHAKVIDRGELLSER